MSVSAVEPSRFGSFQNAIAANVRARAAWLGLNQAAIADNLGVTRTTVSRKWSGGRPWSFDELEALAEILDTTPWALTAPSYEEGGQPKLAAVRSQYTARDSNPEPID